MPIVFACFAPHPPILLPSIGSKEDRKKVGDTINALQDLGIKLKESSPDLIVISSPHPDWGFEVPLFFLAKDFQGKVEKILTGSESPQFHFEKGKEMGKELLSGDKKIALIASGDTSHALKEGEEVGPYQFHSDGPEFDEELKEALKKKNIETILELNELYPQAAECGLRSFCFLLGILEVSGINYRPEILSYQAPFGVGYLVVNFKL